MPNPNLSKLEAYLAIHHPNVKQLTAEVHDEIIGWYQKRRVSYVLNLQFAFGVVKVASQSSGMRLYEVLVLLLDNFDAIMEAAREDMLKSSEIRREDHASIVSDTFPNRITVYPDDRKCRIGIRHDSGYWKRCADELHEYGEVCCAEVDAKMVYTEWYFST